MKFRTSYMASNEGEIKKRINEIRFYLVWLKLDLFDLVRHCLFFLFIGMKSTGMELILYCVILKRNYHNQARDNSVEDDENKAHSDIGDAAVTKRQTKIVKKCKT
jgi:hypothetical protein